MQVVLVHLEVSGPGNRLVGVTCCGPGAQDGAVQDQCLAHEALIDGAGERGTGRFMW
jgi:hypothetical protein